jgi:hypothetical protein
MDNYDDKMTMMIMGGMKNTQRNLNGKHEERSSLAIRRRYNILFIGLRVIACKRR